MSSNNDFTTPEKKRDCAPPAAPVKKRLKETPVPTEDSLLLIAIDDMGRIVTYSSSHTLLSGISGYHSNIEKFFSDELFERVLDVVGGSGYSSVNRDMYLAEEIMEFKKTALVKLFSQEIHGGAEASAGDMFRGTIVV